MPDDDAAPVVAGGAELPSDADEAEEAGDVADDLLWAALDVGTAACELAAGALMFVWRTSEKLCDGAAAAAAFAVVAGLGADIMSKIARAMNGAACA